MKRIPLTQGKFALVDDEDYEALARFKWYLQNDGYAARNEKQEDETRRTVLMHRVIAGAKPGDGMQVDHRDVDKLNNRRGNLRSCLRAENLKNYPRRADNTSGFKGVTRRGDKWLARIGFEGRYMRLGVFETPELAHEFYCLAADMLHGEFARHA
jgi:hypothetical protein